MRAIVYDKPFEFKVKDIPKPNCTEKQVLIQVKACGICKGADLSLHAGGFIAKFPLTPGHEFSGVIAEIGSKITKFKIDDRVVGDNAVPCGECYYCKRNEPLYCTDFYSLGCNGPGGFAEYILIDENKVFKISDRLTYDEACFAEPIACGVHAMDRLNIGFADHILIFGAGPTGIVLTQLLKNSNASRVVSVAPTKSKLDILEELDAAETVVFDKNNYSVHENKLLEMEPEGFDIVIDTTANIKVMESALKFIKKGGKFMIFGPPKAEEIMTFSPSYIFMNEITIVASFAQTHCFERAVDCLEKGIVRVNKIISHHLPLEDYGKGLELVAKGANACMKIIVHPLYSEK